LSSIFCLFHCWCNSLKESIWSRILILLSIHWSSISSFFMLNVNEMEKRFSRIIKREFISLINDWLIIVNHLNEIFRREYSSYKFSKRYYLLLISWNNCCFELNSFLAELNCLNMYQDFIFCSLCCFLMNCFCIICKCFC
jgi:hypothetical protein